MRERIAVWMVWPSIVFAAIIWLWIVSTQERHRAFILWFDEIVRQVF